MIYLTQAFFWLVPTAALVGFIVTLCVYLAAKRKNKREPGSIGECVMKARKNAFIVCSVVFGLVVAMIAALVILLYTAVAFM
jgi:dipeptide/tripeptide permease